jgi:fumarylacetoacetase
MGLALHPLNHTHDPAARSWLKSANLGSDFPIQNLPIAVFRRRGTDAVFGGGIAIGDQVVDLSALGLSGLLQGEALRACSMAAQPALNEFMAAGPAAWQALRHALFALLENDATSGEQQAVRACLLPQNEVEYAVPARIGDYTDFYTSIYHARNVSQIVKPGEPLPSNFQWIPIAYHGRTSSIVVSGTPFKRPMGQAMPPGASEPVYGPCKRLDFELELGLFIGAGNPMGQPITLAEAENHIFGVCLLNDWSARDIQFWEMTPLGPFLGKNFCTTISPWIISMEALAPYRLPFERPAGQPQPLAYLDEAANRAQGVLDIQLEVLLQTPQSADTGAGAQVTRTSFRHQYWTLAQMVTQHTMGGCNLQPGDLLGTGTISGPTPQECGALVELTKGGREPLVLSGGEEQRTFLLDGDSVVLRGWCEKPGAARIGFGECRGTVLPAIGAV